MTRILALGGKPRLLAKAAALGIEVVQFVKPSQLEDAAWSICAEVHVVDFQDPGPVLTLAKALHADKPFARIATQTESAQQTAAYIGEELGLPGNSLACVSVLHDKFLLRQKLNELGLGTVKAAIVDSRSALEDFFSAHGPLVIKPRNGSGSLGVRFVVESMDVGEAWEWAEAFGLGHPLVEERLQGTEISVESFSSGGVHHIVAMTGKDTAGGTVEIGHVVPFVPVESQPITDLVRQMLDATGFVEGAAHTELMLTPEGPRVIESHARRGGDRINDLVQIAHGVDIEELSFRLALEDLVYPEPEALGGAAIRYLVAEPGIVESIQGVAECEASAGVVETSIDVAAGDRIHPLRWSEDRCGWVLARGATPADAIRAAEIALAQVSISTRKDDSQLNDTLDSLLAEVDEVLDPFADFKQAATPHE